MLIRPAIYYVLALMFAAPFGVAKAAAINIGLGELSITGDAASTLIEPVCPPGVTCTAPPFHEVVLELPAAPISNIVHDNFLNTSFISTFFLVMLDLNNQLMEQKARIEMFSPIPLTLEEKLAQSVAAQIKLGANQKIIGEIFSAGIEPGSVEPIIRMVIHTFLTFDYRPEALEIVITDTDTGEMETEKFPLNTVVPIPPAIWLFGSAIVGLAFSRRKTR